jgi:hypothetical protein
MDAAPRTLEVEHHKLTAKLEAAERAAERAVLEKSRLQNDSAIQRTQLEEAVAALRRCEADLLARRTVARGVVPYSFSI